jgi:hypothetical protein
MLRCKCSRCHWASVRFAPCLTNKSIGFICTDRGDAPHQAGGLSHDAKPARRIEARTQVMPILALVMMALQRWLWPAFCAPFLPPAPVRHAPKAVSTPLRVAHTAPARLALIHLPPPPEPGR